MSLKKIPFSQLLFIGAFSGVIWGLLNLGLAYLFQTDQLEGPVWALLFSFSIAGAFFALFILFLAAWFTDAERQSPYLTLIRISLLVWLISVVMGGIASRYNPERYPFDWIESFLGGIKLLLLGILLGWRIKRMTSEQSG
jgi:hypothetical protein